MGIEIYVQARMNATRLPGKVLLPVLGKPLLAYLCERLQQVSTSATFCILTSTNPADDKIVNFCEQEHFFVYRGPEEDVLTRYFEVAKTRKPDAIVRVTADCPLIDPEIIDKAITLFKTEIPKIDYVSNALTRTYPRGLDVEVFSYSALEKAFQQASSPLDREHVTRFIYHHPDQFNLKNITNNQDLSKFRWTVDTPEDFELIKKILEEIYPRNRNFRLPDLLQLMQEHPEWEKINSHILQKPS